MIKNDKQYKISKEQLIVFQESFEKIKNSTENDLMKDITLDAINSQIETFQKEIKEYENLKLNRPETFISTFEKIPETLIKARIINGYSQKELAERVGLKEQQIQRYESSNYASANFNRILLVAQSLGIKFNDKHFIKVKVKPNKRITKSIK
jgi:ribosome-binding protein aMBF1 (putative translation factor)